MRASYICFFYENQKWNKKGLETNRLVLSLHISNNWVEVSFHFLTIVVLKTLLIYLTTQIYLKIKRRKKVEYNKIHARYSKWKLKGKIMKMAEEIDKIFKKLHHQNGPHRAEKKNLNLLLCKVFDNILCIVLTPNSKT